MYKINDKYGSPHVITGKWDLCYDKKPRRVKKIFVWAYHFKVLAIKADVTSAWS
jgi:hypothetical protein